ncbi:MAG TPA: hypothetical protein VGY76_09730 [Solirubrobacteraceae bacterium]|nr:hypothetical protein [Solirubrobacteraceae bacterium]
MTDFLDEKRDEIDDRLAELKPVVAEYNRLLAAAAALRGVDGSSVAGAVVIPSPVESVADVMPSVEDEISDAPTPASVPRRGPGRPRAAGPSAVGNGDGVSSNEAAAVDGATDEASDADRAVHEASAPRSGAGPRRAGRPKGSGTRAAEALRIVREHPGVTIPELADRMGIKQNYLYRVLPELVQEGKVAKQGRGWHPRAA